MHKMPIKHVKIPIYVLLNHQFAIRPEISLDFLPRGD